jgi:thymidylate synthase (FAD)
MVSVTMEITTTRDIARQILRHRSFSFQEFSQRYADPMSEDLGFSMREARLQDTKNRQNSIEVDKSEVDLHSKWRQMQHVVRIGAESAYKQAIELGIAKEQARALLPEGLTNSRLYMAGTLRSWIHFCSLRIANGTQKEHSVLAAAAWQLLKPEFPNVTDAVEEIGMIESGRI